jgi:hypothetical protein
MRPVCCLLSTASSWDSGLQLVSAKAENGSIRDNQLKSDNLNKMPLKSYARFLGEQTANRDIGLYLLALRPSPPQSRGRGRPN